jgi:gamma-glutamylcyclotransferase (GGCT)/AIG2-like uncharacterized protein YtfP
MEYKVGQIFYLVGAETAKVIPFRVVEEVTRTTLEGQEKSYVVELPDAKRTKVDVSKLKGDVFTDLDQLRKHMLDNARNAIDGMIDEAELLANSVYYVKENIIKKQTLDHDDSEEKINKESVQNIKEDDKINVDMGNGLIAKMSLKDLDKVTKI